MDARPVSPRKRGKKKRSFRRGTHFRYNLSSLALSGTHMPCGRSKPTGGEV
jgi:hypothetical protein